MAKKIAIGFGTLIAIMVILFIGASLSSNAGNDDKFAFRPLPTKTRVLRALNTDYRMSDTSKPGLVLFPIQIDATISLMNPGQSGTVFLEDSVPGVAGWEELSRATNGITGTAIGSMTLNNIQVSTVAGFILTGNYYRLRTTGTATITALTGTETKF